jgi:hypothetical protein
MLSTSSETGAIRPTKQWADNTYNEAMAHDFLPDDNREGKQTLAGQFDQCRGPEDGISKDGLRGESSSKRKFTDREPESPGQQDPVELPYAKKERTYYGDVDTDSPSSYPKHVIVPVDARNKDGHLESQLRPQLEHQVDTHDTHTQLDHEHHPTQVSYTSPDIQLEHEHHPAQVSYTSPDKPGQLLTPDSADRGMHLGPRDYEPPIYSHHQPYQHDVYRAPSYNPDMDYGRSSYGGHHHAAGEGYIRPPRRWACDYCNVATFLSYEEACAHEEACARRHHDRHYDSRPPRPPVDSYHRGHPHHPHHGGLGALYHASQEVVTPPTPHHHGHNQWGSRGPPLPVLPHEQNYYRQGYYDRREDLASYHAEPYYPPTHGHPHPSMSNNFYTKRMLLAMVSDKDSLSDRQCYVRSEMVEIFAASEKDVAARHSKGAQKLILGQVGVRCVHCSHLRPRDRAERAVCYPSSISRIYQTVADMQRFHFEQCREIPDHVRQLYKKLKTTRPRGVGSPQTYWVSSAKTMGLCDTGTGIRFETDMAKEQATHFHAQKEENAQFRQNSAEMSINTL